MSFYQLAELDIGGVSSATISNFSQKMNHIYFVISARSSASVVDASLRFRFNGDSGNNYSRFRREVNKTQTSGYVTGENSVLSYVGDISIPGASGLSSAYSNTLIDIFDYNNISRYTFFSCRSSNEQNSVGKANHLAGMWKSVSPVSSITIYESSGSNFATGSKVFFYGLGR